MYGKVRADFVTIAEISEEITFDLEPGTITILLTPKNEINIALARVLTGLALPQTGNVDLFDEDTATLTERQLREIRRRIGLVYGSGGLVSNLKVWENLTLPLYYHWNLGQEEIEKRGLAMLERVGFDGRLMELPGHLAVSRRKLVGLARAMLIEPEIMIYESPTQGLNKEERNSLFKTAAEFHHEKEERITLFLTSNPETVAAFPEATVVDIAKGQH